jgi:uncharacterized repeat protein (TIGR02543 family)
VGWWPGEGNADDTEGSHNGSASSGVSYVIGEVGRAFKFDGAHDFVAIPNSSDLDTPTAFTIEFWMRADSDNNLNNCCQGLVASDYYGVVIGGGDSQRVGVDAFISTTSGADWATTGDANGGGAVVTPGVWHHVAATYNGSQLQLFIDGQAWGVPNLHSGPVSPMQTGSFIGFGSESGRTSCPSCTTSRFFKGQLDEVAIYSRALTTNEIHSIYVAASAGKCGPPTPPTILLSPTNQTATAGGNVTFNVIATGSTPLSFQWQTNNADLPGATNTSLILTNLQISQGGNYGIVVTNLYGTASTSAVLTVVPPPSCVPASAGMVGWWRGEGNTGDQLGTNNGAFNNVVAYGSGEVGSAFLFDGVSSYVSISRSASLDTGAQLTMEAWIKPDANSSLTCCKGLFASDFYGITIGGAGIIAYIATTSGAGTSGDANAGAGAMVSVGQWHHVAGTYDGAKLQLYIDGQAWGNPLAISGSILPMQANSWVSLGSEDGRKSCPSCIGTRYFKGLIDEAALYNRALSASAISQIYNAGISGKCSFTNAPVIVSQPLGRTVPIGSNITFTARAAGSPILSYQWLYQGSVIVGATNSSFVVTNVHPVNSGNYSMRVTNNAGSMTSSNAVLNVIVITAYAGGQALTNSQASFSGPVSISLQSYFTNGLIFYTLDGSEPTFSSTQYTGPFTVSQSSTLRALTYSADFSQSGELDPISLLVVPTYSLVILPSGGGSVAVIPAGTNFLSNTVVSVSATASAGWTFLQWLGDLSGGNSTTNLTVNSNKKIQAVFGTSVGTTSAGNGSVNVYPLSGLYAYGTVLTMTALPQAGSYFGIWGNAASGNFNPLSFTVTNANPTVSSLFSTLGSGQVSLTIQASGLGKATASPRANVYSTGASVLLTATPSPGQTFTGWSGDATNLSNPLTITMDRSKVITANFTRKPSLAASTVLDGLSNSGFRFTLTGEFPHYYEIDMSGNFLSWTPLAIVSNAFGLVQVNDAAAPTSSFKYYRALAIP